MLCNRVNQPTRRYFRDSTVEEHFPSIAKESKNSLRQQVAIC